jgi:putative glutamine amidotransferase
MTESGEAGRRPRIGIPAQPLVEGRVRGWPSRAFGVPATYVRCVRRAGGLPVVLTSPEDDPDEALTLVDGLLLMGGGDVAPSRYGGDDHPELYGVEPDRDGFEIALLGAADRTAVPTLAICRGIQVLNVALGGTLHPHLPDVDGTGVHGAPVSGDPVLHDVKLVPGGRVGDAAGADLVSVSSHHHQGIDRPGEGLAATGWSEDGLVEAVELERGWIVGVQWHPEDTADRDPAQQRLFDELIRRSAARAIERTG